MLGHYQYSKTEQDNMDNDKQPLNSGGEFWILTAFLVFFFAIIFVPALLTGS